MTAVEYLAIAGIKFIMHVNLPGDPVFTTSRMTSAENLRQHTERSRAFKLYHDVDKALRKQLIAATLEVYLQDIRDPVLGYANTTCLAIITTHLRNTYGEISQEDLDANETWMGAAWNPPIPIEDLFEQLCAGAAFATEGGDALPVYSKKDAMTGASNPRLIAPWRLSKKHFKMWEKDRRLMLTTGTAGFHGANHVEPPAPVIPPAPVAPINVELVEMRAALQAIQLAMAVQALPPAAPAPAPRRPAANTPLTEMGYCWMHGYSGNLAHTSVRCVNRAEGISKMPHVPIGWQKRIGSGREPIVALLTRKEGRRIKQQRPTAERHLL
eukprot:scaffold45987_cov32-Attheya_sp.AAC.2